MVRCIFTFFLIRNQATEPQPLANSLLLSKLIVKQNGQKFCVKIKRVIPTIAVVDLVRCWMLVLVADSNSSKQVETQMYIGNRY